MSRKYNVSRSDKGRINRYYGDKRAEAKEAYKARTGLKIARGFEQSPEGRKIRSLENRALRRSEIKREAQQVAKATIGNKGKKTDWSEVTPPQGTTITPVNADGPQPFYSELSYGGGSDKEVVSQWKLAQAAGFKVIGIINNTFTRAVTYSYDLFTFKQRIKALYKYLKDLQKELNIDNVGLSTDYEEEIEVIGQVEEDPPPPTPSTNTKYPLISTNTVEDILKKTLTIVVEAHG